MKKKILYSLTLALYIIPLSVFAGNANAMRRIMQTMKDSNTTAMQMVALLDEAAQAGQEQWIAANLTTFITQLNKENNEETLTAHELQTIKTKAIKAIKKIKKRKKQLMDSLLAQLAPLQADERPRIHVSADIEGNWDKVKTFVEKSDIVFFEHPDDPNDYKATIQNKNAQFVFLGDALDKGPNNRQVLQFLIHLKKRYPKQVTLIMGNRDINKLRFHALSELTDEAIKLDTANKFLPNKFRLSGWENLFNEWLEGKLNKKTGEMQKLNLVDGTPSIYTNGTLATTDKILKLKFLMQETLGAGLAFNRETGEITSPQNAFDDFKKESKAKTDEEAFNKYMEFVGPKGLVMEYLQLAEIIHFDKHTGTLFMHGGLSNENFGYIPETVKGNGKIQKIENNIPQWVNNLNHWAQDRIKDGIKKNVNGVLPLIEYQEPETKEEDGLIFWDPNKPNPYSVVQARPWGPDKNLKALDPKLVKKLIQLGVNKIVFGHSPVGEVPVIIKGEKGFISIAADTSYARAPYPRNAVIEITKDSATIYADYYETSKDKMNNDIVTKNELTYSSKDPRVGVSKVIDKKTYWNISPIHDGKDMLQGTWSVPAVQYRIAPMAAAAG
ncbi:MAG TPA: metallophosphoesterase [Candidatus Babeliales bacterium]|nr:metallophosphoesterase [Candidatus Babeliales bacterium]